ncbi:MAG: putative spermidine/putrescine transport system permease protein [Alphaproteobacteria bacterium]|jgi:putative spermidine/putrescine transport system permease protein|nr:putative spermidine/putrescine transport system permease protein [Alphaproteobacteria bacterium]
MQTRWGLFAIPSMAALGLLFIAPQFFLAVQSLHPNLGLGRVGTGWTLDNYVRILSDAHYLNALLRTIWISLLTTGVCLVLGYPVAYFLARTSSRARGLLTLIVIAPLLITIVVRSLGWIILLSNTGPVNFALQASGLINGPIPFIYNQLGVILGLVHAFLPMMIVILIGAIQQIDRSLEDAAADLGANRLETFARVVIPLSLPGISAGGVLIFGAATSVYTTTIMLGGGRVLTTPIQIGQELMMTLNYPVAAALAVIIASIAFGLAIIGMRLTRAKHLEIAV